MNEVILDLHAIFKELKEFDKLISPQWVKNSYILLGSNYKPKNPFNKVIFNELNERPE